MSLPAALALAALLLAQAAPPPPAASPPPPPPPAERPTALQEAQTRLARAQAQAQEKANKPKGWWERAAGTLGAVGGAAALLVSLGTFAANYMATLRNQADQRLYELLKRFGDPASPAVRANAAALLAEMGAQDHRWTHERRWRWDRWRRDHGYHATALNQLTAGLLLESDPVVLHAITDGLAKLGALASVEALARVGEANRQLQGRLRAALADFYAACGVASPADPSLLGEWRDLAATLIRQGSLGGPSEDRGKDPGFTYHVLVALEGRGNDDDRAEVFDACLEVAAASLRALGPAFGEPGQGAAQRERIVGGLQAAANRLGATVPALCATLQAHGRLLPEVMGAKSEQLNCRGLFLADGSLFMADLRRADFSEATLIRATLTGAKLAGASLFGTRLTGANLVGAALAGAALYPAAQFGKAIESPNVYTRAARQLYGFARRLYWWQADFGVKPGQAPDPETADSLRRLWEGDREGLREAAARPTGFVHHSVRAFFPDLFSTPPEPPPADPGGET